MTDKKIEEFEKAINNACNNVQFDESKRFAHFSSNSEEQLRLQDQLHDAVVKSNPEVSWVRLVLEGMVGFSSPFQSLRTILWY